MSQEEPFLVLRSAYSGHVHGSSETLADLLSRHSAAETSWAICRAHASLKSLVYTHR